MIAIGVAQISNSIEVEKNFDSIMRFLKVFEREKVDLVVFPECSLSGFSAKIKDCTEEFLFPFIEQIQSWSTQTGIEIILPTAIVKNEKIYNSGFWFKKDKRTQFYKYGLTDSEKMFFSVPSIESKNIYEINTLKCALLICKEAEQNITFQDEIDFIIWPGYWGWTIHCAWEGINNDSANLVFMNSSKWKVPIIQSNFAFNNLGTHVGAGPEGLSVVIDMDNQRIFKGQHLIESCFLVNLEKKENDTLIINCRDL